MVVCLTGDDLEHEQDTVLQLQEVIEQLRNVFPSEPGESHGSSKQTLYNSVNPEGRRDGAGVEGLEVEQTHTGVGGRTGRLKGSRGEELE